MNESIEQRNKHSRPYLWLLVGALLLFFSDGRWMIPLASWLAPVFLLRFTRSQGIVRGYLVLVIVNTATMFFPYLGIVPMPLIPAIIVTLTSAFVGLLPFVLDRILARRLKGLLGTLLFPCAMVTLEYFQSFGAWGSWGSVAYTQWGNLPLIQLASVTGIWGICFLIRWFASLSCWAWEEGFEWKAIRFPVCLYASLLACVVLAGGARLALFPPASPTVRVAGIVPAKEWFPAWGHCQEIFYGLKEPQDINWDAAVAHEAAINNILFEDTRKAARAGAKIVAWSETACSASAQNEATIIEHACKLAREEEIYLVMPMATTLHHDPSLLPTKKIIKNWLVLIEPSGKVLWEYVKSFPVPGWEKTFAMAGKRTVHTANTLHGKIAGVICYDMDFPWLIRQVGKAKADILCAPAADWKQIVTLHQHMALFRAIENGVSLLRPVSNGLLSAADYQGRILTQMDAFSTDERIYYADIPTKGVHTVYSQIGDFFAWLCIMGLFAITGWSIVGKRRYKHGDTILIYPEICDFFLNKSPSIYVICSTILLLYCHESDLVTQQFIIFRERSRQ